jgi:exonuclease III
MEYGYEIWTWNVRSLYRKGSLVTVSKELSKYKLDLVGVQEVRWKDSGNEPAGEYTFFYGREMTTMNSVQGFCA